MSILEGPYGGALSSETGATWDDQSHGDVKKITIWYDTVGINSVQFDYIDGMEIVHGEKRGKLSESADQTKESFVLAEGEYIKVIIAYSGYIIRKIEFQTNKRILTSGVYTNDLTRINEEPVTFGRSFKGEPPYKIVGFNGRSGDHYLHQIGVHWSLA